MDQERTYKWIQDKLRDLQSGTIADGDRRELEALAKENPFVADALEGYDAHVHIDHSGYLDSLTKKIKPAHRVRRRWLIPNLTVTAIAASLILIVGFWAVMSRIAADQDNQQATAANEYELKIESKGDTTMLVPEEESSIATAESKQNVAITEEPVRDVKAAPTATTSKKPVDEIQENEIAVLELPTTDEIHNSGERRDSTDINAIDGIPAPPSGAILDATRSYAYEGATTGTLSKSKADDGLMANQMNPVIEKTKVTGRITSLFGEPLIGAGVMVKGTNQVTVTGIDGKFELFLPRPESEVEIAYTGYELNSVTLRQGEEDVQIVMKEGNVLNEVVVGKGGRNRKMQDPSPKMNAALPMDSLTTDIRENLQFIDYLKSNSRYPLADSTFSSSLMVTVSFDIDAKGRPGQINVLQSSGKKNLDEEAIRLIKKGPDWECMSGSICRGQYSIYFKNE